MNPVNLLSQPEQMRYVLEHSDCRVVFVAPEWEERVRAMLAGIDAARSTCWWSTPMPRRCRAQRRSRGARDVAAARAPTPSRC